MINHINWDKEDVCRVVVGVASGELAQGVIITRSISDSGYLKIRYGR